MTPKSPKRNKMPKKFYITTPIYYVNDVPHIGHTCTTIAADIVARYQRLKNKNVFFLTGTDEHGAKVAESAKKSGLSPQEFCNKISPRFQKAWQSLNISNDFFIRTTDPRHEKVVKELFQKIYDQGDLYKSKYEGLYCIGCEKFLTESDLENGHCPLHPPHQTVKQKEENWFFRLSKYVPHLIKLIEDDQTNYILPEGKRNEVLAKLKSNVHDISFTRAKVDWGIPVPWDKSQTIYVWVDALINYYSATRFLKDKKEFWPADVHVLGKEILWFHTVIWQAMLLSAKLPLPKKTFVHSFYIMKDKKMSKSLGNFITPEELVEKFGVDGTRYLIASSFPTHNDTNISIRRYTKKYNADLANALGNLVSRTAKLCEKNNISVNKKPKTKFFNGLNKKINNFNLASTLNIIWNESERSISATNQMFTKKRIWELKADKQEKELKKTIQNLHFIAFNLQPFMPQTAKKITETFTGKITAPEPLFPRK